ncbi:hypothetical protein G9A89_023298 [Geosiphon pyriformis]|nr:hypothetical protein G9A89_023298 [Geosiphon pyriformis]
MCNVHGLNNPAKQDDVICWDKDMNNLVSIFTESKLKGKVCPWLANKFDGIWVFTSGLDSGSLGTGVLIVMNSSLVKHVYKISEVPGQLLSIKLLFKNKLSVFILGLYASASSVVQFSQAGEINFLIAKAVNESSFVVLGGNFNKDGSHKCASFKKCFDLGLINSLRGSSFVKSSTWCNFCDITKTLDYMFVSSNLVGVVVDCGVDGVEDYFDTNHKAVYISKYNIKNASEVKWLEFRNATAANAVMFSDEFDIVHKIMVLLAGRTFKKKWFKDFDCVFNKNRLDSVSALPVKSMFLSGTGFDAICSGLAKARKSYHSSKLLESKHAEESCIRQAIERRMESFEIDKGHIIRSVLEHPFCKVVLDYLVNGKELVLKPELVKSKVDGIMEGWTRKCVVASNISGDWARQFWPLDHVFDGAFSDVIHSISFDKMFGVISNLLDGKAADLSGITNELWKHCDNTFDVLCGDNFSVLKNTSTHSPIFTIGLVIKDALEKNRKLWLVLQDMCKAYDFVGWEHLKRSLTGWVESQAGLMLFLATGVFVDDTIWVSSSQTATQHILNVASDFFRLNNILINNDKTVIIPINCWVAAPYLTISDMPISITKRGESHYYLGIFLSSEGFSKPSLVKAHSDVRFFINFILRKVISDKQFAYLLSSVLFPIISYRTQFSFIFLSVCNKWDTLICKSLKSKFGLPLDFLNNVLYHFSLYNLKTFEQIQAESKLASVIAFVNLVGVLDHLFSHRSYNLQVLSWHPHHPLLVLVCVRISSLNNFLTDVVYIFSGCDLSLGGSLISAFCLWNSTFMSLVLGKMIFFKCVFSLRHYNIAFVEQLCDQNGIVFDWATFKRWKRLDSCGSVSSWFDLSVHFLGGVAFLSGQSPHEGVCGFSDIHQSSGFGVICNNLLDVGATCLSVYTDGSLSNLGIVDMLAGAVVFFKDINLGLGVGISGVVSSTLVELQTIALALECVFSFHSVDLFSDSQVTIDAYRSKFLSVDSDFKNCCWIEHCHITNVICHKNLDVNWIKVKGHSDVSGNEHADVLAKDAALSAWRLPHLVNKRFLKAGVDTVSGNSRDFVCNIFRSIHHAHWEIGSGSQAVPDCLCADIDWLRSSLMWHLDSHLVTGFTSIRMAGFCTYFIKALHYCLPIAVQKRLYDKGYPSVVCLFCDKVEVSDHIFSCSSDADSCTGLLDTYATAWELRSGLSHFFLCFVFSNWYCESVFVYKDLKVAVVNVMNFVREFCLAFCNNIWLVCAKHRTIMEKNKLIPCDGSILVAVSGFSTRLLAGVIRLLGVADALGISFGYHKHCLFYTGVDDMASVHISA